jgi:hypothetical protein
LIAKIQEFILKNQYSESLDRDQLFVYDIQFNSDNKPVVGNGSADDHLMISVTSKQLLENLIRRRGQQNHIDATYKITKNGFCLIVFGFSNYSKFWPVAISISSHETFDDYKKFYNGLKSVIKQVHGIDWEPDTIMQDAYKASYKAAKFCFDSTSINMCYFHTMFNVRKQHDLLPGELYKEAKSMVKNLHWAKTQQEFDEYELFTYFKYNLILIYCILIQDCSLGIVKNGTKEHALAFSITF